jgi:signal transduction histidine kinase
MFNPALPALYQWPPPSLRGRTWREICPASAGLVELTFRDRQPLQDRIQIAGAEGRAATIDVRTYPLVDSDDRVSQVVLHLTDTTERLQYEALALKNERLAASGRLAAIVAHEVNTPLQALQNFVYLAATDNAAERDAYLSMVGDEIERIGVLIRRLLDIHREGDGAAKAIDIADLVDRVLTLVGGTLTRRRVQVARDVAPLLPPILGRSDQLTQVLLNLIINARDAMPSGGTLTVRIRLVQAIVDAEDHGAPALLIEVADTGSGILPSALPRIFEPFFTTKADGSGLGLPISRQIVEQHGGRLSAGNDPAGGAVFQILLPAFPPPQ